MPMKNLQPPPRVFCLGLDGGTWTVLQPLLQAGHLPNLLALANDGLSGVLHSTIPPITPAAWSTFMTGCNPGKHGIFDFQGYDRRSNQAYLVNATSLRVPTLWQLLSQHGKRVAVVDLPVTYPPPAVNGVIVSGLMTPSRESTFTHPATLLAELEAQLGYEWPLLKEEDESGRLHADFSAFLKKMRLFLDSRVQAMLYLLRRAPWDFAFLQLQCVDFLQHALWPHLEAGHPDFQRGRQQRILREFFAPLDQAVGELVAAARASMGEQTLMLVLSDHGFQRHRVRAELNHWLHANGFLVPQTEAPSRWMRHAGLIRRLDVLQLRKRLLPKSRRQALGTRLRLHSIDHQRSLAYAVSSFWGYLYLGPGASVSQVADLIEKLYAWRDPATQQPVVRKVFRREEIFSGPACERLPDLIVEPAPGCTFSSKTFFQNGTLLAPVTPEDFHAGTHESRGIFVLNGAGVVQGAPGQSHEAALQDVMPTLLHWLGLPVPAHCDGRVRSEWFDRPAVAIAYHQPAAAVQEEVAFSDEEERELQRRLQTLGYM